MIKFFIALSVSTMLLSSCGTCEYRECQSGDPEIVGAYCNDGTDSEATGAGACSGHGGVRAWKCQKCD